MDKRFVSNLLTGLLSTSLGQGVTISLNFLSVMLTARYVPKEVLGLFFLASTIAEILKIICGLGLDLTLVKFVSDQESSVQHTVFTAIAGARMVSIALTCTVFYLIGTLVLPIFDARLNEYITIILILTTVISFRELFLHLIQGVRRFKAYAGVQILSAVVRVILLVVLSKHLSLSVLLYIEVVSLATSALFALFMARDFVLEPSIKNIGRDYLRELFKFSGPVYSNGLLTLVYDRSSVMLTGALLSPVSVAAYVIAGRIPMAARRLFDSVIVVYYPSLSTLFSRGDRSAARRMMNSFLVLVSTGIVLMVLVSYLFAKDIVLLVFSEEYIEVSLAFVLLMLSFCLRAISNVMGYSLLAAGNSLASVTTNLVASAVNILSGLVLIQRFGYMGAVYALLLMNITSQILYQLQLRRMGIAPRDFRYLRPFLLLAPAILIDWLLGGSSTVVKMLLVVLYLVSSVLVIGEVREVLGSARGYVRELKILRRSA